MFPDLSRFSHFCIDTETTGLSWMTDKIFGIALSTPDNKDYYWDVRDTPQVLTWLRDQVKNPNIGVNVNHNNKFDALFFREAGIYFPDDKIDCTMIRSALIDEHRLEYNLDAVGHDCIGVGKDTDIYEKLAALFGGKPTKNAQMPNLHRAPVGLVAHYAKQDSRTALQLWEWQEGEIKKQSLENVADLERRLIACVIDMERRGVRVNPEMAQKAVVDIDVLAKEAQAELNHMAGFEVNPNPSGSITKLFEPKQNANGDWVLIDGTIAEKTDGGKASINAEVLRSMRHPAAAKILALRKMLKTRDTFFKGHILGCHRNGLIHANINQTKGDNERGTGTGRLSYNGPALQQIHKRDKAIASVIRSVFIPDGGQEWVCCDLKQAELRWFGHYANDPRIIKRYLDDPNTDFYQTLSDMTGIPRNPGPNGGANTKQLSLAAVFGMSDGRLSMEMGFTPEYETGRNGKTYIKPGIEGQAMLDQFNRSVPGIKSFLGKASAIAKDRGYVRSVAGRHIRFPRGQFTHKAGGLILQSANADAIKSIMVAKYALFKNTNSRLLISVHDETGSSIDIEDKTNGIIEEMKKIMESLGGVKCRIPHRCDPVAAANWWEGCK